MSASWSMRKTSLAVSGLAVSPGIQGSAFVFWIQNKSYSKLNRSSCISTSILYCHTSFVSKTTRWSVANITSRYAFTWSKQRPAVATLRVARHWTQYWQRHRAFFRPKRCRQDSCMGRRLHSTKEVHPLAPSCVLSVSLQLKKNPQHYHGNDCLLFVSFGPTTSLSLCTDSSWTLHASWVNKNLLPR